MTQPAPPLLHERRATCARCARPQAVCVCARVPVLQTANTHVVLLQHPRESRNGIGTARLAHLALPGSVLKAGLDFSQDADVQQAITAGPPAYVLFPGPSAIAIADLPREEPITLIVVDGTWWQAKKLIKLNPWLQQLPCVAFSPTAPSDYRIRRQPAVHCVSTIEALAEVLSLREPAGSDFQSLRDPFRAMVDLQVKFRDEVSASRHRGRKKPRDKRRATFPEALRHVWDRLVFVQGEANAWPARRPDRPPPELVHVVAQRAAAADDRFEAVLAPRQRLAPSTSRYVELSEERLHSGQDLASAQARWQSFLKPGDILCAWGPYHVGLAQREAWAACEPSGKAFVDMRNALSQHLRVRLSMVEDGAAALGIEPSFVSGGGRAWRRLFTLVSLANSVHASP